MFKIENSGSILYIPITETYIITYIPIHIPIYLPTYILIYLPTYQLSLLVSNEYLGKIMSVYVHYRLNIFDFFSCLQFIHNSNCNSCKIVRSMCLNSLTKTVNYFCDWVIRIKPQNMTFTVALIYLTFYKILIFYHY